MKSIEKLIAGINNLPTLPTVFATLSEAIEDPRVSIEKLAEIISSDQASAFKVLKVANSSFYGFRGKIDTISQAILYIGFNEVRNIVFALSVMNVFSRDKRLPNYSPTDLWAHSIGVGIITRFIGKGIGERKVENFFLAGILHDIGKIILLEFANEEYSSVLRLVESKNCSMVEAELEVFGMDHARVGQMLAEKWKLPSAIQKTILHHHNGVIENENNVIVASVHIANIAARMLGLGYSGDNHFSEPNLRAWDILKIPPGYFASIYKQVIETYDHTIRIMLVE